MHNARASRVLADLYADEGVELCEARGNCDGTGLADILLREKEV